METAMSETSKGSRLLLAFVLASFIILGALISLSVSILTHTPNFQQMRTSVEVPIKHPNGEWSLRRMVPR